jgi:hypothetical protein
MMFLKVMDGDGTNQQQSRARELSGPEHVTETRKGGKIIDGIRREVIFTCTHATDTIRRPPPLFDIPLERPASYSSFFQVFSFQFFCLSFIAIEILF